MNNRLFDVLSKRLFGEHVRHGRLSLLPPAPPPPPPPRLPLILIGQYTYLYTVFMSVTPTSPASITTAVSYVLVLLCFTPARTKTTQGESRRSSDN